jgi:hypothetical protein
MVFSIVNQNTKVHEKSMCFNLGKNDLLTMHVNIMAVQEC